MATTQYYQEPIFAAICARPFAPLQKNPDKLAL